MLEMLELKRYTLRFKSGHIVKQNKQTKRKKHQESFHTVELKSQWTLGRVNISTLLCVNPHTSDFLIQICIHYSSDHVAVNRGSSNANIANITVTQAHMSQGILASKCASIQISISLKIPSKLILFSFFFLPSLHFLFMYQHSSFGVIYILFKVFIKMQNIYFFSLPPLFHFWLYTPPPPLQSCKSLGSWELASLTKLLASYTYTRSHSHLLPPIPHPLCYRSPLKEQSFGILIALFYILLTETVHITLHWSY